MDEYTDGSGQDKKKLCFVIMPIGSGEKHTHFSEVYETIFKPAIENAGFIPYRADKNMESNIIHVDIIESIFDAPIALCDVTGWNANVLYELGLRHLLDNRPVVVVQAKEDESKLFDVGIFNILPYSQEMKYNDVKKDRQVITEAIKTSYKSNKPNSLIISTIKRDRLEKNRIVASQNYTISEQVGAEMRDDPTSVSTSQISKGEKRALFKEMNSIEQVLENAYSNNNYLADYEKIELIKRIALISEKIGRYRDIIGTEWYTDFKTKIQRYLSTV